MSEKPKVLLQLILITIIIIIKIRRKRNLQILGNLGGWHHQTSGNERHNSKRISQEN